MNDLNKAIIHGVPGETARARGVMRAIWPLLAALFACGVFCGAVMPRISLGLAGAGFVLAAAFLAWAVRDGLQGINAFFKGARGEEAVAALLADLPGGYHVFHDFGCAGRGIDHVVVGSNGVFVVETKCWAGQVDFKDGELLVDGGRPDRSPLNQVRAAALSLEAFLSDRMGDVALGLLPVVCFASDTFVPGLAKHTDTVVCNASRLLSVIQEQAGRLAADDKERIVLVMEHKDS
ncbi:MAG: nuclease-related domain-containing protein [Kiritimatiellae bacterium]|nr:nuclease-related domain-containing protein [Kiritimatiellia bacterium]